MGAARNVGKGLIDGNPLNEGRKIINYLDGRVAQPLVFLEMAGNKNELRAELARSSAWHTPADPAGPGFVGSGEDNSATDSDGAAAQGWIEQLLDRSIERIQVCMKDRGCRFQLFFVHHSGQMTKDQQGAEPGQIARSRLASELCLDRRDVASKRHALTTLVSVASHLWRFHHGRYLSWLFLDPNCLP
jgi:hypothetical protein